MDSLIRNLRLALRQLARRPTFSAVAVLSLALGIGANTTVFSIANELFLRPLAIQEPERMVAFYTTDERMPGLSPVSHLNWKDLRDQNGVFDEVLGFDFAPMSVSTGGEPTVLFGQMVSGNYFSALGVQPQIGRGFLPEEDVTPGTHPVVVLSHRFWTEGMGSDRQVLGQTLAINSQPFTIVGVAPASFTGLSVGVEPELWVPMMMNPAIRPDPDLNWYETRRGLFIFPFARLKPGVSTEEAERNLQLIAQRLEQEYPEDNSGRSFAVRPLAQATIFPGLREGLVAGTGMLMVIVALVLLIACANVANLLLARASQRRKEIAVRLAIGADRRHLVGQLLTESLVVALSGGLLGLLVALWARQALLAYLPSLPFPVTVNLGLQLDARVLAFTIALSILTGLIFGLVPALQASRPNLVGSLKEAGDLGDKVPSQGGWLAKIGRSWGGRQLLVVVQVALCLVALAGASLFLRSLAVAQRADPGFERERLAVLSFDLGLQGYETEQARQLIRDLEDEVRSIPGIEQVTYAQAGPLQATVMRSVLLAGAESEQDRTLVQVNLVEPSYFDVMSIPLLRGRGFQVSDRDDSPPVVIINETMAERFWPGEKAVGQRFTFFGDEQPSEVVGVARDAKYNTVGEDPQPYIYQPLQQRFTPGLTLIARTAGDPALLLGTTERRLRDLAPELPLLARTTVGELLHTGLWAARLGAIMLAIFGFLALTLAAIGLYGVLSFAVERRQREIGIRMALGADRGTVLGLVLRQGLLLVLVGLTVGLLLSLLVTRSVQSLLFVSAFDPLAFGLTLLVLVLVSAGASFLPAYRATGVNPIRVLRQD